MRDNGSLYERGVGGVSNPTRPRMLQRKETIVKCTKFWLLVVIGVSLLVSGCDGEGITIEVESSEPVRVIRGTPTPTPTAGEKANEVITIIVKPVVLFKEGVELTAEQVGESLSGNPRPEVTFGDGLGLGKALEDVTSR